MKAQTTTHKRGDDFGRLVTVLFDGAPVDLSNAAITSQVRALDGTLIDNLTIDVVNASLGKVEIVEPITTSWPLSDDTNPLLCDVKVVDGDTNRTTTFEIHVDAQVTE